MIFNIRKAVFVSEEDHLERLFTELRGEFFSPDLERINKLIQSGQLAFYVVESENGVVGMASVIPCRTAVTDKLYIEDVAVLSDSRGMGIGRELMNFAMEDSEKMFGAGTFCLTSRPSRVTARSLYRSLGFEEYETGVFRRSPGQARG